MICSEHTNSVYTEQVTEVTYEPGDTSVVSFTMGDTSHTYVSAGFVSHNIAQKRGDGAI
jgi:hypothetical protein